MNTITTTPWPAEKNKAWISELKTHKGQPLTLDLVNSITRKVMPEYMERRGADLTPGSVVHKDLMSFMGYPKAYVMRWNLILDRTITPDCNMRRHKVNRAPARRRGLQPTSDTSDKVADVLAEFKSLGGQVDGSCNVMFDMAEPIDKTDSEDQALADYRKMTEALFLMNYRPGMTGRDVFQKIVVR